MDDYASTDRAAGTLRLVASEPRHSLRARRRRALAVLAVAAGAVCLLLLPPFYVLTTVGGDLAIALQPEFIAHLAMVCVVNLVVAIGALRLRGRLDQRLTSLFRLILNSHGGLALLILAARLFYSIPLMVLGVAGSLGLGAVAVYARGRIVRLRIGVLGPSHAVYDDPRFDCVPLEIAAASLQDLDLVLLTHGPGGSATTEPMFESVMLRGLRVRHAAEFLEEMGGSCDLGHFKIDQISGGEVAFYRRAKRILDLGIVLVSLPLALPITVLAALGVLLTMGWPVFYHQSRVGLGGRTFAMVKLRTMRTTTPTAEARATLVQDSRVTPFGRVLRRLRIDELPQFVNVLRGEMSVIGPRPEWTRLAEEFQRHEPKYALRHLVRPGITGWAQVRTGPAADLAETRVKLAYDLFYLKNMSLALDLQILWRTSWTLLAGGGVR